MEESGVDICSLPVDQIMFLSNDTFSSSLCNNLKLGIISFVCKTGTADTLLVQDCSDVVNTSLLTYAKGVNYHDGILVEEVIHASPYFSDDSLCFTADEETMLSSSSCLLLKEEDQTTGVSQSTIALCELIGKSIEQTELGVQVEDEIEDYDKDDGKENGNTPVKGSLQCSNGNFEENGNDESSTLKVKFCGKTYARKERKFNEVVLQELNTDMCASSNIDNACSVDNVNVLITLPSGCDKKSIECTESETFSEAYGEKENSKFFCDSCGGIFNTRKGLVNHARNHPCISRNVCVYCEKHFENGQELKVHTDTHIELNLACDVCNVDCLSLELFEEHQSTFHSDGTGPHLCKNCDKVFYSEIWADIHRKKQRVCPMCYKVFCCSVKVLRDHMKLHHHRRIVCSVCNHMFRRPIYLEKHMVMHRETMYKCDRCDKKFVYPANLMLHKRLHSGEIKCIECNKVYRLQKHLDEHRKTHQNNGKFKCRHCDITFMHTRHLENHIKGKHTPRYVECKICKRQIHIHSYKLHQERHEANSLDAKLPSCEICQKTYKHRTTVREHQRMHSGKNLHQCEDCGQSFLRPSALEIHQRIHSGERPFLCHICHRRFIRSYDLKKHISSIHQRSDTMYEEPGSEIRCEMCSKIFISKSSLEHHVRNYDHALLKCKECSKVFATRSALQSHQRRHSGEMPYQCTVCGRKFPYLASYIRHKRIHQGIKRFHCERCGKQFREKQTLNRHELTHLDAKLFACEVCHKRFKQKVTLDVHSRIHRDLKPYKCAKCLRNFRHKVSLRQHRCISPTNLRAVPAEKVLPDSQGIELNCGLVMVNTAETSEEKFEEIAGASLNKEMDAVTEFTKSSEIIASKRSDNEAPDTGKLDKNVKHSSTDALCAIAIPDAGVKNLPTQYMTLLNSSVLRLALPSDGVAVVSSVDNSTAATMETIESVEEIGQPDIDTSSVLAVKSDEAAKDSNTSLGDDQVKFQELLIDGRINYLLMSEFSEDSNSNNFPDESLSAIHAKLSDTFFVGDQIQDFQYVTVESLELGSEWQIVVENESLPQVVLQS